MLKSSSLVNVIGKGELKTEQINKNRKSTYSVVDCEYLLGEQWWCIISMNVFL